jgi:hypothetical protein
VQEKKGAESKGGHRRWRGYGKGPVEGEGVESSERRGEGREDIWREGIRREEIWREGSKMSGCGSVLCAAQRSGFEVWLDMDKDLGPKVGP